MSFRKKKHPKRPGGGGNKKGHNKSANAGGPRGDKKTVEERLFEFLQTEKGTDTKDVKYSSFHEMWKLHFAAKKGTEGETEGEVEGEVEEKEKKEKEKEVEGGREEKEEGEEQEEEMEFDTDGWYGKSSNYWEKVEATVDGMLGGFESVSDPDIKGSMTFIKHFITGNGLPHLPSNPVALDVGAGIGRITKGFLSTFCSSVDLLEPNPKFLEVAQKSYLVPCKDVIDKYICSSIQDMTFENHEKKYDLIWIQWVIIYITDNHLINFLKNCAETSLKESGLIVVKDNVLTEGFCLDVDDSSITRSDKHLKLLFEATGLTIVKEEVQRNLPTGLFPVKTYALTRRRK